MRSKGFSLIELMIVIAIIGILTSIAVPSYNIYIRKAYVTEALMMAQSKIPLISEFYALNGSIPCCGIGAGGTTGFADISNPSAKVQLLRWYAADSTHGRIEAWLPSSFPGASAITYPEITLTVDPNLLNTGQLVWICGVNASATSLLKYLPSNCQNVSF